ncbi:MAG: hypothetical protein OXI01_03800 [Albidovulum sp.]|nr:hypothetical protein [Albidovulum sp.]
MTSNLIFAMSRFEERHMEFILFRMQEHSLESTGLQINWSTFLLK